MQRVLFRTGASGKQQRDAAKAAALACLMQGPPPASVAGLDVGMSEDEPLGSGPRRKELGG